MLYLRSLALISIGVVACATSLASEPVSTTLSVGRVVSAGSGQEKLEKAASARPGDVLEYAVDLHNGGSSAVHGLSATLPLPAGTELMPDSARPSASLASTDGREYSRIPLRRTVVLADGTRRDELVPIAEYRFLRWAPGDLAANSDLKVSARVRVNAAGGFAGIRP